MFKWVIHIVCTAQIIIMCLFYLMGDKGTEKHKIWWSKIPKSVTFTNVRMTWYVNCSVQNCSYFSTLALELLQSCTRPSMCQNQVQVAEQRSYQGKRWLCNVPFTMFHSFRKQWETTYHVSGAAGDSSLSIITLLYLINFHEQEVMHRHLVKS